MAKSYNPVSADRRRNMRVAYLQAVASGAKPGPMMLAIRQGRITHNRRYVPSPQLAAITAERAREELAALGL
jgi:hypothetical protein